MAVWVQPRSLTNIIEPRPCHVALVKRRFCLKCDIHGVSHVTGARHAHSAHIVAPDVDQAITYIGVLASRLRAARPAGRAMKFGSI